MKLNISSLRSKVARRIFLSFVLCALLPITVLAVLSFFEVTSQLKDQSRKRLQQGSKVGAMNLYARLQFLEAQMRSVAADVESHRGALPVAATHQTSGDRAAWFSGIALSAPNLEPKPLFGSLHALPPFTAVGLAHLRSGKAALSAAPLSGQSSVFMSLALHPERLEDGILVGELNPAFLWQTDAYTGAAEFCALDGSSRPLFCSGGAGSFHGFLAPASRRQKGSISGEFEWSHEGHKFFSGYWSLFLKPEFSVPDWTVVSSEPVEDVYVPLARFQTIFPLVILLAVWVVLLLSLIEIRRSLDPLEKLREGTRRIAVRDFESRVSVSSKDEFEELAVSFNGMARHLGKHFNTLTAMNEIYRTMLVSLETEQIVATILQGVHQVFTCEGVSIALFQANALPEARSYTNPRDPEGCMQIQPVVVLAEELEALRKSTGVMFLSGPEKAPGYVKPLQDRGMKAFSILPLFDSDGLLGVISLGHTSPPHQDDEDLLHIRQAADQMAIALSNARLVEKLDQVNAGTLMALARAIDAKSPWTAGHSERVTRTAVRIAQHLGLSEKEQEMLYRGGLVHDIGKIGVSAEILNKPGKLTPEEYRQMQEHVAIGARILEPMPGFADILPIVWEHHERFDGTGYPRRLAGEQITLHGRIFAVADVYDALISDRPYRTGWELDRVIAYIRDAAGTQFDPRIVEVFLRLMAQESPAGMPVLSGAAVRA